MIKRIGMVLVMLTFVFTLNVCGGGSDAGAGSPNTSGSVGPQGPQGPAGAQGPAGTNGLQVKSVISCDASGDLDSSNNNVYGEVEIYRLTDDSYFVKCESCFRINKPMEDPSARGCGLFHDFESTLSASNFRWVEPLSGDQTGFGCSTLHVTAIYTVDNEKVRYVGRSTVPNGKEETRSCTERKR